MTDEKDLTKDDIYVHSDSRLDETFIRIDFDTSVKATEIKTSIQALYLERATPIINQILENQEKVRDYSKRLENIEDMKKLIVSLCNSLNEVQQKYTKLREAIEKIAYTDSIMSEQRKLYPQYKDTTDYPQLLQKILNENEK